MIDLRGDSSESTSIPNSRKKENNSMGKIIMLLKIEKN